MSIANGHLYVNGLIVAKVVLSRAGRVNLTRTDRLGAEKRRDIGRAKRERRGNKTIAFEFGLASAVNVLPTVSPFRCLFLLRADQHLLPMLPLSTKLETLFADRRLQ